MLNLLYIVQTTPQKGAYIMKKLILTSAIALLVSSVKDAGFINSMASAANGMGAKEPLTISESNDGSKRVLVVAGSNGTTCRVPVSDGNPPKMMGINCK